MAQESLRPFPGLREHGPGFGSWKAFAMQFSPSVFWDLGAPSIVPVTSKEALSLHADPNQIPSTRLQRVGGRPPPVSCLIDRAKTQSHLLWTLGAFLLSSLSLSLFISLLHFLLILKFEPLSIEALMPNESRCQRTGHCGARDRPRGGV